MFCLVGGGGSLHVYHLILQAVIMQGGGADIMMELSLRISVILILVIVLNNLKWLKLYISVIIYNKPGYCTLVSSFLQTQALNIIDLLI